MTDITLLEQQLAARFSESLHALRREHGELTLELRPDVLLAVARALRDEKAFQFDLLLDVCGVDYLHYGLSEWETVSATRKGFERGVDQSCLKQASRTKDRFAVVLHLLSISLNHRLRVRIWLDEESPALPSVSGLWPADNWFEREAFDLFGVMFTGHPDLRRILTDYGFIGHPFRKDFPLSGHVEVRYDAARQQVINEPVSIVPRVLEPKVIRDNPAGKESP